MGATHFQIPFLVLASKLSGAKTVSVITDLDAENEYFSKAVCLNDRGLVQGRAIGEIIKKVNIPYHVVVSSPSCRARQTAKLAFGG